MQRQLQLQIEAQGKYLKKMIEERHHLSGVLSAPGPAVSAPGTEGTCQELDNKTDAHLPCPSSEPPFLHKPANEHPPAKHASVEELFSNHEPSNSGHSWLVTSSVECSSKSPGEKAMQKHQAAVTKPEVVVDHLVSEDPGLSPHREHATF